MSCGNKARVTAYVLKSLRNGNRYIGYTSKNVFVKLYEHNHGTNKFTIQNSPFELYRQEMYSIKTEVIKREKFLKSGQGRKLLDGIIVPSQMPVICRGSSDG